MSLTGNKIPGAAEWYGEYLGISNQGDYNNNNGGLFKFPDGTIWRWDTEASAGMDFPVSGLQFFELKPGSAYWEHISADWRDDQWINSLGGSVSVDNSGDMREYSFGTSDYWCLSHSGDDDYVYAIDVDNFGNSFIMFNKATYEWERFYDEFKAVDDAHPTAVYPDILAGCCSAAFDRDYGYYIVWDYDFIGGGDQTVRMVRFRRGDPTDVQYYYEWDTHDDAWMQSINSATGRRNVFNEDWLGGRNFNIAYYNEKFYIIEGGGTGTGNGWGSIREWDGVSDSVKLLYWHDDSLYENMGFGFYTQNVGTSGGRSTFPEEGVGHISFVAVNSANAQVRDGWLYWLDQAGISSSQSMYFARINLDQLLADYATGGPVKHDPGNPRFEVLCNASAPWESDAKWIERQGWGVLWREGNSPIYNTIDNNWFFDDDGSIIFAHEEFPNWATDFEQTHWVISKLSPPGANTANVSLVFEGQALKGYSNVRQQQTAWAPSEVVLR